MRCLVGMTERIITPKEKNSSVVFNGYLLFNLYSGSIFFVADLFQPFDVFAVESLLYGDVRNRGS